MESRNRSGQLDPRSGFETVSTIPIINIYQLKYWILYQWRCTCRARWRVNVHNPLFMLIACGRNRPCRLSSWYYKFLLNPPTPCLPWHGSLGVWVCMASLCVCGLFGNHSHNDVQPCKPNKTPSVSLHLHSRHREVNPWGESHCISPLPFTILSTSYLRREKRRVKMFFSGLKYYKLQ